MAELVLVYPKTGLDIKKVSTDLPLSSLSVASVVSKEREVKIIDQRMDEAWEKHLKQELQNQPLAVGISSMTGTQIKFALDAAESVKENSSVPVVFGGIHATLLPEQTIADKSIDYLTVGEGEASIKQLLDALSRKAKLSDVPNLYYKRDGQIKHTALSSFVNPNDLPSLDYSLIDVEAYVSSRSMLGKGAERALPFITSRGCPYRCTFCCNPRLSQRRWRFMDAEKAYNEVMEMVERFRLDAVMFHDENFLGNPKRAERIAEMIDGKFKWSIQARMDGLEKVDLRRLAENGLNLVQPGVESGSERILNLIKKDETIETTLAVNKKLAETSITPVYNFMMGFPTETIEELYQTIDLSLRLLDENPKAQLSSFYVFTPYPGTELFDLAVKEGFKPPKTLREWAGFSRHHLKTPWIQENLGIMKTIMYTSKLVDGKRLEGMFASTPIPKSLIRFFGNYYRKRWEKHNFKNSFDIKFMNFLTKAYFKWE